jgi:hypothetical protein
MQCVMRSGMLVAARTVAISGVAFYAYGAFKLWRLKEWMGGLLWFLAALIAAALTLTVLR